MAELVSSIFETRKLLLKNDNYKKIVIDAGSDVVTVESHDGIKLYLNGDDEEEELLEEIGEEDGDDVVMEEEEVEEIEEIEEEDDDDVIKEVSVQKRKIRVKSEVEEIEEEDDDDSEEQEAEEIEEEDDEEEEVEEIEEEEAKEIVTERSEEIEQITNHILNMGKDLHTLIQNIDKVPNPPPTNNPQYTTEKYRSIILHHLQTLKNADDFEIDVHGIFIPVVSNIEMPSSERISSPSQGKSSLSFILKDDDQPKHTNWDEVDPSSLIKLPEEEMEIKQKEACQFLVNKILDIYKSSIKDRVQSEMLRRNQFKSLISLLEYYEKLEIFCNLHLVRAKGDTIKSQATKAIVKSASSSGLQLNGREVTVILSQAARIRRLLSEASNNYNVLYTFPDLNPNFFLPKKLTVVNFERWLKLVKTGELPSVGEGKKLYKDYKEEAKQLRQQILNFQFEY